MVPRICPTYTSNVASVTPLHTSGAASAGGPSKQPSFYLIVKLASTVRLFKFQLFLAEFHCVYSQFDPGRVIQSIPNSQMEIHIFLQNSTLNENFAEKLLQVWQNETKRKEVFSAQTRDQV